MQSTILRFLGIFLCVQLLGTAGIEAAQPQPPAALAPRITETTEISAQIQWQPFPDATRYEVSFGTNAEASNRQCFFHSETSVSLKSLQPNTIYYFKIRPVVQGQAGGWSPILEFSTLIPALTEWEADDIRNDSIHLSWKNRYADLTTTSYEVVFSLQPDSVTKGTILPAEPTGIMLRQLSPNTTYAIAVRARNPKTIGPWSNLISVTTLLYAPNLAPTTLSVSLQGKNTAFIQWPAVKHASAYEVSFGTDPQAENQGIQAAPKTEIQLQLQPHTQYYFKVRSIIWGWPSRWSVVQEILTLPFVPLEVNVATQTQDQVTMGWQSPAETLIPFYYELSWGTNAIGSNMGTTPIATANVTLSNLQSDCRYAARVRMVNASGPGPWSEPVTFVTLPSALRGLDVYDIEKTQAKLRWQTHPRARSYELSYGSDWEASNKFQEEVIRPPVVMRDLIPDLTYYVKIRPILQNLTMGPWSETISFTTFAPLSDPSQPEVSDLGSNHALLSWPAVAKTEVYQIFLALESETVQERTLTTRETRMRLTGLEPNSVYTAKIRADNRAGSSEWSEPVRFITAPDAVPSNFKVSSIGPNEASVHWDVLPGSASTHFLIRYASDNTPWVEIADYPHRTVQLAGLTPQTGYRVQIQAQNSSGVGPWSSELRFQTLLAPPRRMPQNLHARAVTDISAAIAWDALADVDIYQLSWGTDTDASDRGIIPLRETSHLLKGLNPDTHYFVKVKAVNSTGESPWTDALLIATPPSPPMLAPTGLQVSDSSPTSLSVVWNPSAHVAAYEVSLGTDPQAENQGQPQRTDFPALNCQGLKPRTEYHVKVRSINRGGPGPWSRTVLAQTEE